ncbi:cation-transporting P-type ATPase, partial [Microcystis aeruginosa]
MVAHIQNRQFNGLSSQEASDRLKQHGYNELPSTQHRTFLTHIPHPQ